MLVAMLAKGLKVAENLNFALCAEKRIFAQNLLRRTLRLLAGVITEIADPSFGEFVHGLC